ncbi:MAG: class I SAM-dependent methyltransferase [Smithella sp.]|jgi:hypothetical protein
MELNRLYSMELPFCPSTSKPILDACCGSRMFWFNKHNPNVVFCDNRIVPEYANRFRRRIEVMPNILSDFTALPFSDNAFQLVVFDPPHLDHAGKNSWLALKYGCLDFGWPQIIHDGFAECMRVLCVGGSLIFKWSEGQIPIGDVLRAIQFEPLFGNRNGKNSGTHWMCFMKER